MLRAIFFHQCSSCRELYEALNTVVDPDPDSWAAALYHLGVPQGVSEVDGWCVHPSICGKTCPACSPVAEDRPEPECNGEEVDF